MGAMRVDGVRNGPLANNECIFNSERLLMRAYEMIDEIAQSFARSNDSLHDYTP